MKIRTRFSLFTMGLVAASIIGLGLSSFVLIEGLLSFEFQKRQDAMFNDFVKICEESTASHDDLLLVNYIQSLRQTFPEVAYAAFVDKRRGLTLGKTQSDPKEGPVLEKETDLPRGRTPTATAKMGFYKTMVEMPLRSAVLGIRRVILNVTIIALFLGVVASWIMAKQITQPLSTLAEGAKAVGEGNLDTKIALDRSDELQDLAHEFNRMAVKLKELDNLKDEFVSSVSHELRSPLAAIDGYVDLLTAKPFDDIPVEKRKKALNIIRESSVRLTHFINDVLDFAKIKAGRIDLRREPFSLKILVQDLLALFTPLFDKKKITAEASFPKDLADINADEEKIRQVLTNLVSNALKFTPEGGRIRLEVLQGPEENTIKVSDSGIGIPKESLEEIFERFKQVKNAREKVGGAKGTGLGLAIAKGIVEAHGGRIWAESEIDKGSTFHFTLKRNVTSDSPTAHKLF